MEKCDVKKKLKLNFVFLFLWINFDLIKGGRIANVPQKCPKHPQNKNGQFLYTCQSKCQIIKIILNVKDKYRCINKSILKLVLIFILILDVKNEY